MIFLIQIPDFNIRVALFVITYGTVLGSIYALGLFAGPFASALIDEAALKENDKGKDLTVSDISGSYSGLNLFMISLGQGFASIMIGFILIGPNAENPMIITLCLGSAGIFYMIALLFLMKVNLNKKILPEKR